MNRRLLHPTQQPSSSAGYSAGGLPRQLMISHCRLDNVQLLDGIAAAITGTQSQYGSVSHLAAQDDVHGSVPV